MAISSTLRAQVLERDGFRCKFCGANSEQIQLQVDHIKPRAEGGTDSLSNLATLCQLCNRGKSDKYFGDYMQFVQNKTIQTPNSRSKLLPPLSYQINAVSQILTALKNAGVDKLSLPDLAAALSTQGERDGITFFFEPISFATVKEGLDQIISEKKLIRLPNDEFEIK